MRATLKQLLDAAQQGAYAVPAFNVFGYEDALAVVREAESRGASVILATNKEMTEFMGVTQAASMLGLLAEAAGTPVCVHLDHCYDIDVVKAAIDAGYGSVMYDGSQLPLAENIANTRRVVDYAHAAGVSVEGEIGSVAYSATGNRGREHIRHELTEPEDAELFAVESGVDAVAVSVGNVHRLETASSCIDFDRVASIAAVVEQPLVIHGTSGIGEADLVALARGPVAKFNIGTTLRQSFGRALRNALAAHPDEYDRLTLFRDVMPAMSREAGRYFTLLSPTTTRLEHVVT